jgi:hypothetical protein
MIELRTDCATGTQNDAYLAQRIDQSLLNDGETRRDPTFMNGRSKITDKTVGSGLKRPPGFFAPRQSS